MAGFGFPNCGDLCQMRGWGCGKGRRVCKEEGEGDPCTCPACDLPIKKTSREQTGHLHGRCLRAIRESPLQRLGWDNNVLSMHSDNPLQAVEDVLAIPYVFLTRIAL